MKTRLAILLVLALGLTTIMGSSLIADSGWYAPSRPLAGQPGWEKWELHFTFYVMDWKEFQKMIEFYEGKSNYNIIGYCVSDGRRADVYVPMTNQGNVDFDTVGHEVCHVVDMTQGKCRFDPDRDKCKSREPGEKSTWILVRQESQLHLLPLY